MKKSFSILGAFCLGLFISVSIIACAVDGDYNGNTPGELTPQEEQVPYVVNIYSENGANADFAFEADVAV